ncbi:MAG: MFS transporter [Egibacteraceae bacterium]
MRRRAAPVPSAFAVRTSPDLPQPVVRAVSLFRDRSFVAALVVAVVVALGFGLIVPLLPQFARSFGVSLFAATAVVSVFAGVRLASNLVAGSLADRIGTRRAIAWGVLVVGASSAAIAGAPSYAVLVTVRGLGGFGSALFSNALLTFVVSRVQAEQRGQAVGMLHGAFMVGLAFGPSVGGLLAQPLGLRWPFAIYGVLCAAAGLVALGFLPPASAARSMPNVDLARTARLASLLQLCRNEAFVAALVMIGALRWAAAGVRDSLVPLFGSEVVGATPSIIGLSLTLAAIAQLVLVWPAGKVADRFGRRALAWPGFLLFAVIVLVGPWARSVPAFLALLTLYGISTGLVSVAPAAIIGDVVPPGRSGIGVGALSTAGDLGSVLGPLVSGWLADQAGYSWAFGASAALLLFASATAFRMRETLPRH